MFNCKMCKISCEKKSGIPSGYCSWDCFHKYMENLKLQQKQERKIAKITEKINEKISNGTYTIELEYDKAKEKFNIDKDQYLISLTEITKAKEKFNIAKNRYLISLKDITEAKEKYQRELKLINEKH